MASNSAVSDFSYSDSTKEIRFTVNGESGTLGYAYVYVPKSLINDVSKLTVYLDNSQIDYTAEPENNYNRLFIRYQHSTHTVTISSANSNSSGDLTLYAIVATIAGISAIAGIILTLRRRKPKTETENLSKANTSSLSSLLVQKNIVSNGFQFLRSLRSF
jgi:hypothetical protein